MTALERLIKLASTDGAAHYRELAKEAQKEYNQMITGCLLPVCSQCASGAIGITGTTGVECGMCGLQIESHCRSEPAPPSGMKRGDVIEEITIKGPSFTRLVPKEKII